jgi:formyl-CoA transferase
MCGYGVLLALQARHVSGEGQRVDVSMYDAMIALNEQSVGYFSHFGKLPPRGKSGTAGPYGTFACKDGQFVTGTASNAGYQRFCGVIGAPDLAADERMHGGVDRAKYQEAILRPRIEEWARDLDADEASARLNAAGVPAAPVQDVADLFQCAHVRARHMIVAVDDPVLGRLELAGDPIKLGSAPETPHRPAPQLGADQARYLPEPAQEGDTPS